VADVLVVSDRPEDLLALVGGLEAAGHRIAFASSEEASRTTAAPGLVIVDAVKDLSRARDTSRGLRANLASAPVIVVVAPEALDALGPDWDIDSFLVDGASTAEVLARVRVALGSQVMESSGTLRVGDLSIDPETYQVRIKGRPLDLTYKEFQLLSFLAQRPGRVWSRQQLLQEVWGYDFFGGTRTVDVHVRRLRAKLGAEHENMIATIRNVGYKLEAHRAR
jgi:DNA-binding response OmpR family regulator